jgi:hypothetical protein
MANALYGKGREAFLLGDIDWVADDIKAVLVDTGTYTVSINTHQFHSDLSGVVATSGNLASKTATLGTADAADLTFTGVSGVTAEALVLYKDTGVSGTSPLIAYIDTATGLPLTPNSGDVTVTWDSGANKIFTL